MTEPAGTVIGSGTVANADAAAVGSGCIAERRALDQTHGRPSTPFLRPGEQVRIDCVADRHSVFGPLDQLVTVRDERG